MYLDSLKRNLQSLSNSHLGTPDTLIRQYKAVVLDYETALMTTNDNLQNFYTIESRGISYRATVDALGVVEQSESVGQLTSLFVPLSFVASLFGMSLRILNSGPAPIMSFITASIGTMMTVITLLFVAPLSSRFIHALRRNLDGLRFRRRELRKTAIMSPIGALWLFLYCLTHDPEVFAPLIKQLGIWVVLGLHQDWEEPEIINSRRTMRCLRIG